MSAARSVTATFAAAPATPLKISVAGGGTVTDIAGIPSNISCDETMPGYTGTCSTSVLTGTFDTLTATPKAGYAFAGWFQSALTASTQTGCSGTGACTFTKQNAVQYVTAIFTPTASAPNPLLVYQDILSGPTTGGENGKGIYLSVFGKNIGTTGAGTTVRMYLDNIEVDNYRYVGVATKGRTDMQQLAVQVGPVGGAANNADLPIKVIADGRVSNTAASSAALTFKVNPGNIYFVALTGDDSTGAVGDITKPYRTVQKNNYGGVGTCPLNMQTVAAAGVWGLVRPGDFMVLRGGTWTDTSAQNAFFAAMDKSGKAPTGAVDTGPITLMGYPGETVFINKPNTAGDDEFGGGISGPDSGHSSAGCGAWIALTNLKIESGMNDGPINTQNGALNNTTPGGQSWRVVNNEMTGISCQNNTYCKGAGVSAVGFGHYLVGNYVHDMYDKVAAPCPGNVGCGTDFENHGFYLEGKGSYEVAYNRIENIYGGNGVQTNATAPDHLGVYAVTNAKIHHNIINGVAKHGINIGNITTTGLEVYNNIVMNTNVAGIRNADSQVSGAKIYNNTVLNIGLNLTTNAGHTAGAIQNDSGLAAGQLEIKNNIFVAGTGQTLENGSFTNVTMSNNLFFLGTGSVSGTANQTTSPMFVACPVNVPTTCLVTSAVGAEDLHLTTGSAGINNGTAVSIVLDDFEFTSRPIGAWDIGAYEQ